MDSTVQTVQEVGNQVSQYRQMFENYLPDITKFGIKVVLAIVAFWVGSTVIKWIVKFVRKSLTKSRLDTGVAQFMSSLVKIVLYILLIFNISISFGVKESSLAALLGTAGVTMGLALQGGLANLAGGMMLLLFKPFQVGDYIIVNGQDGSEGTVAKVEICYTTLLSIDNKHIVIPNGTLSNVTITNVTARDQRRLEIKSGDLLQCRYPEGQGYPGRYPHRGSGYKRRRRDGGIRRRAGRKLCDHGLSCLGRYRPLLGSQMEIEPEDQGRF
mgnify:FL=1